MNHRFVCADCGHEQAEMMKPCEACNGGRVVLISMIEQAVGKDWRKKCFGNPEEKT